MSIINDERDQVAVSISCIKFIGNYDKFYYWKKITKAIARHKGILKYITKEADIPTEDKAYNDEDKMKIYEGKSKTLDLLIIILTDIPSGFVRQCDQNSHESRKALIDKYEVSDEKQDILNKVTNR